MTADSKSGMNKKLILGSIVLLLVVAGGIAWFLYEPQVAVVGKTIIYKKDAHYRDQVVRIYFPEEKRDMGLFQLMKSAYNIEILRNYGIEFSEKEVIAEKKRMEESSKDPEMLKRIRDVFGKDEKSFLRSFVLPNLADHHIYYDFFLVDQRVQGDSMNRAHEFIKMAEPTKGKGLEAFAKERNLSYDVLTLSLKNGMMWGSQKKNQNAQEAKAPKVAADPKVAQYMNSDTIKDAEVWYEKMIQHMQPGQFFPEPVSVGENWVVVFYEKKINADDHRLQVVFVPKTNFGQWYQAEKTKIEAVVKDPTLIPKGL
ncbi:hypothetical protein [Bdellovibrio sp. HCB337]|uniref:hypothetical protein n=1 Tax=Bdellovibrio sp. HCB337 TaxID=3394358 RepID=UPI0039A67EE5